MKMGEKKVRTKLYTMKLELPLAKVWEIIGAYEMWVPLLPGYLSHEIINENESVWTIKREIGLIKKKFDIGVFIKRWNEPRSINLQFWDGKERFSGECFLEMKEIARNETLLTVSLRYSVSGSMSKMISNLIKTDGTELTQEIKKMIETNLSNYEGEVKK